MVRRIILSLLLATWFSVDCNPGPIDDIAVDRYFIPKSCIREVKSGDFVRYHYNGTFTDGKQFDSSYDRGAAFFGQVGQKWQIAGVDKGILGMCVNEHRKITVPPHLAYGSQGAGDKVPPDTTLVFDLVLLDVFNRADQVQTKVISTPKECKRSVMRTDFVRFHFNGTLLDGSAFDSRLVLLSVLVATSKELQKIITIYKQVSRTLLPPNSCSCLSNVDIAMDPQESILTSKSNPVSEWTHVIYQMYPEVYKRSQTQDSVVGEGWLIKGLDEGLLGMCVGEIRHFIIPPFLAFGEKGYGKDIPGSAVLVFDIHVIDFHGVKDTVQVDITRKSEACNETSEVNDFIQYHYNCSLLDGTDYETPQDVVLGGDKIIDGLDEALRNMCVGERRTVIVPPHLGHGEKGAGIVPGSAVLRFELELVSLQKGVPEGYLFIWLEESPGHLFEALDVNQDQQVPLEEFSQFIKQQVSEGKGRLKPAQDPDSVIIDMFKNQDRNTDGLITQDELKLKVDEDAEKTRHEEL
uniref:peptidylprolyl isomerase n=1 Tax=Sinocyclocheilus rhinocerous TaxID=307959 RepID=A0A673KRU9_9TELE